MALLCRTSLCYGLAALVCKRVADPVLGMWQCCAGASLCYGLAALACEKDAGPEYGVAVQALLCLWAGYPCVCYRLVETLV